MLIKGLMASISLLSSALEQGSSTANSTQNLNLSYSYMIYVVGIMFLAIIILSAVSLINKEPYYSILTFFSCATFLFIFGINTLSKIENGLIVLSGINISAQLIYQLVFAPTFLLFVAFILSIIKEMLPPEEQF